MGVPYFQQPANGNGMPGIRATDLQYPMLCQVCNIITDVTLTMLLASTKIVSILLSWLSTRAQATSPPQKEHTRPECAIRGFLCCAIAASPQFLPWSLPRKGPARRCQFARQLTLKSSDLATTIECRGWTEGASKPACLRIQGWGPS